MSPPKRSRFWKAKRVFFLKTQVFEKNIHSVIKIYQGRIKTRGRQHEARDPFIGEGEGSRMKMKRSSQGGGRPCIWRRHRESHRYADHIGQLVALVDDYVYTYS
ncbi:hypothetical protein KSP39_PZI015931 [Platanthera zijinensis]|uniref:Uncharacterized protein n=1 Tax=Platanthera zijinensis TaxID=2320716 RepID=A0AAP0B956_9ASPA